MERNVEKLWPQPSPWLVYTHGNAKGKKIQTFCGAAHNQSCIIKRIPALQDKEIIGSCSNWLFLRDFNDRKIFSFWNFVTWEVICLPKLNHNKISITSWALNNGVVFLFYEAGVYYCRNKTDSQWSHQTVKLDGETINHVENPVSCNGVLYAYTLTGLFTIEFANHDSNSNLLVFNTLKLPWPDGQCIHSPMLIRYLLESCGGLYMIEVRISMAAVGNSNKIQQILKVEIWECDLCRMIWVPVESLGNRAFFLSSFGSTWCWTSDQSSTSSGFEGNCVYIAQRDEYLYSYRLKDGTFTILSPQNLITPFYGPAWVMPPNQRLLVETEVGEQITDIIKQGNNFIEYEVPNLEEQNESQEKLLSELPADVIALISEYLHLFDYLNLRASCKRFQYVLPAAQGRASSKSFPFFMFSKGHNGLCELRDICRNDSHSIVIPHSPLIPAEIDCSKDGWLVVFTGGESFQFFNPFTRVKGELPRYEYMHDFQSFGFSTCPTSSECLVVGILNYGSHVEIISLRLGDKTWEPHPFEQDVEFWPSPCSPVYHKEAFYFLDQSGYLGEFKIKLEDASWKVYNKPNTCGDTLHWSHLVECGGELLSVFIGEVGCWVQVFKFNPSQNKWDELKTLGDHILFIGNRSSFSALAGESFMEDRIYMPWQMGDGIVYYSLEDGKYHALGSDHVMEDFCGMQGQSLCCWV